MGCMDGILDKKEVRFLQNKMGYMGYLAAEAKRGWRIPFRKPVDRCSVLI